MDQERSILAGVESCAGIIAAMRPSGGDGGKVSKRVTEGKLESAESRWAWPYWATLRTEYMYRLPKSIWASRKGGLGTSEMWVKSGARAGPVGVVAFGADAGAAELGCGSSDSAR